MKSSAVFGARHIRTGVRVWLPVLILTLLAAGCTPLVELVVPTATLAPTATPLFTATVAPQPTPAAAASPVAVEDPWLLQEIALCPADRGDLALLEGPTRYRLELTLDPDGPRLWGQASISYTNNEPLPLPEFYLRLYPNMDDAHGGGTEITQVTLDGRPVTPGYELQRTALRLPLDPPLEPGAVLQVGMDFAVSVPRGEGGNYGTFAFERGVLALAHFYPFVPVYDDEGWNVEIPPTYGDIIYGDMSLYDVTLTVPEEMVAVATGSALSLVANSDGTATYHFVSGPARDFNLVLSPDYELTRRQVDDVTVNSYYLPGDVDGGEVVLDVAAEALRLFGQRFGRYPYAELDLVPTFTSAAGIEYPGLIVIAQRLYAGSSLSEWVVAHEVAHQWWYNLVGNDQVDEPWLDEALTQYTTVLYFEDRYDKATAANALQAGIEDRWEGAREAGRDRPVVGPVAGFAPEDYGPIVYGKGPLFFHHLREEVGDVAFDHILRSYFQEHRYKIATGESFLAVAERFSSRNVDALYRQWILE